jgi:hypothetical protein
MSSEALVKVSEGKIPIKSSDCTKCKKIFLKWLLFEYDSSKPKEANNKVLKCGGCLNASQ